MTDLTPNDLSHLSDEEFDALCPQGHHAPGAAPLSPAAQAVLDAYIKGLASKRRLAIAAALRAAADQVVPDKPAPDVASLKEFERWDAKRFVRLQFLAIAAELEGR